MVEIQKPHSALKRPSLKRETVVVNNSAPTIKKVTLVPKDEELVAISPERRNWRGIFIALLVIAAVFSLIIFSIFLLSPEDEGLRIRGRRMLPSDILGRSLQWKPFNGTWSNGRELIYRDPTGGLSILNMADLTTRILMTNSTFRQLNAESFLVAPDQKYVLLQSDSNAEGSRESTYRLHRARISQRGDRWEDIVARLEPDDCLYDIPKNCLFNRVQFSQDYSYYVQECLGPEAPSVYLVETASNDKIYVLNAGDVLRHRLSQLAIPQSRTFSVEIRHGFHAQVRLFLPPGMREEEDVAFPLVLHVDASPGSQLVTERFHVDWNWYLASQRSFIVAQIDGRGSGFQGELLRTQVHGKLGTVEVEDQLGVLTYLRDNLKFIDPLRICAFGWGYGGYASSMMLIDDSQQVLQCAVAINPIVNFGFHYSFFTERYIPLKGDYLRALQEADLTMKAGNIKGRNLMLMHGTADTLVHQEHTLMLVRALVEQQVKFRHQVYPDEDHAIARSLSHVYKTMEWYFDECFGPVDDNEPPYDPYDEDPLANQLSDIDIGPATDAHPDADAAGDSAGSNLSTLLTATTTSASLSALDELDNRLQALDLITSSTATTLSKVAGKLCNYSSKRRLHQSEAVLAQKSRILQH
ncbi:GD15708 [Drosophila simulans]|uniref:Venom dipeptidyl peptidase 4 n=1 Tax=Drosophila simulans TaxID=7240 RepID=B4R662_DROSI|nr:GD15708 [Drosophila simulans]